MAPPKTIINNGERFGKLTVLKEIASDKRYKRAFVCSCDCGNIKVILLHDFKNRGKKSCGCDGPEQHRESKTRLYRIWAGINDRCQSNRPETFIRYKGRGISVCEEWKKSFTSFRIWAMANGYNKNLQIDRIDNNGNYEPSNCRWTDFITNNNNREKTFMVTYKGVNISFCMLIREKGLLYDIATIRSRIIKWNWPVERAIDEPINHRRNYESKKLEIIDTYKQKLKELR